MNYEDIPLIVNVSYLHAHSLLVKFSNGEERILDMTDSFEVPAALQYKPLSIFKKFDFDSTSLSWNNKDYSIGHDSIYNMSIPKRSLNANKVS